MRPLFLLLGLFLTCTYHIVAQREGMYNFQNSFEESSGKLPALRVLGKKGNFVEDLLPELNNARQMVYAFDQNCGLQFDNKAADNFLGESYTIEIYFRFSTLESWRRVLDFKNRQSDMGCYVYNGKLNFFNLAMGVKAPIHPREYTHYVISRDFKTKQIKMYVDGESKIEFIDRDNHGVISTDGVLNFFFDDLIVIGEASAGAVSMIKLYDYVKPPANVKKDFQRLQQTIVPKEMAYAPIATEEVAVSAHSQPTAPVVFYAQAQNANTKQPIATAVMVVLDSNMVEQQRIIPKAGQFAFEPTPNTEYNLIIEAIGYLPLGLHYSPTKMRQSITVNNIFALEPLTVGERFVLKDLRFVQSKAILLKESELEMKRLVLFMKDNPTVEIELQGHTDNQGEFELNLALSQQRVEVVKDFLVKEGIHPNRITGKGYGATRPIANNTREETRHLNRRVELIIKKN